MENDICEICKYDITKNHDRGFLYNNKLMCHKCWNKLKPNKPYFIPDIPTFVEGGTYKIFDFVNEENLYEKLIKYDYINDSEFLTKSDNALIVQSNIKSFWWVIGYINNYNIDKLRIPQANFNIYYTTSNTVNERKLKAMLQNTKIVTKDYKPIKLF